MRKILLMICIFAVTVLFAGCNGSSDMKDDISNGVSQLESGADSAMDKLDGKDNNNSAGNDTTQNSSTPANTTSKKISEEQAKTVAVKHAGLKETDVYFSKSKLENDDGILKYEIDFTSGGMKYDYEINAETGEIISFEKEDE